METRTRPMEVEILTDSTHPPKLRLPLHWKVRHSTRRTVGRGDLASPILVVFADAWAGIHRLAPVARKVATTSRGPRFFVLSAASATLPAHDAEVRLLASFPDPERVEVTCGTAEMQRVLHTLIAKLQVLAERHTPAADPVDVRPPRPSPLDQVRQVVAATADLRDPDGNLSAARIAPVFGVPSSQLAAWLGRSRQALQKTPAAPGVQDQLACFERVARLRVALSAAEDFRKWLRIPRTDLDDHTPLDVLGAGRGQVVADLVDDLLTGSPT